MNIILSLVGKTLSFLINKLNLGSGSTWPGHIALKFNKNFIKQTLGENVKIVLVAGTNGKTTTSSLITHILKNSGLEVLQNQSGANLRNGIASSIILGLSPFQGKLKKDYIILEVDENSLPQILKDITPDTIVCLNLFRDQLDRYGEIDSIISNWKESFKELGKDTTLILNADDPQVSYLGKNIRARILYFGLDEKLEDKIEHGADSIYCPNCHSKLQFTSITFSHLGNWNCTSCGLKREKTDLEKLPSYPLLGTYNKYNALAAVLFAESENIDKKKIGEALGSFTPAFGRQEELEFSGKKIKIFLSKNPTSFNQSLTTISDLKANNILIALNDRIPDGRDVSWIWDTNTLPLEKISNITISGDRAYDMALRIKYSDIRSFEIEENLETAVKNSINKTKENDTLFILPTYSSMLEIRKILKGRSIL